MYMYLYLDLGYFITLWWHLNTCELYIVCIYMYKNSFTQVLSFIIIVDIQCINHKLLVNSTMH